MLDWKTLAPVASQNAKPKEKVQPAVTKETTQTPCPAVKVEEEKHEGSAFESFVSLGAEEETRPLSYPSLDDPVPASPKKPAINEKEEQQDEVSRELMAIEQQRRCGGNEDNVYLTRRGRYVTLRWHVRNMSTQPWPEKVQLIPTGGVVPVKAVNLNHVRL